MHAIQLLQQLAYLPGPLPLGARGCRGLGLFLSPPVDVLDLAGESRAVVHGHLLLLLFGGLTLLCTAWVGAAA